MPRPPAYTLPVTPQQVTVLKLAAEGKSNRVIATEMGIGKGTVNSYLRAAAEKLGVENKMAAIRTAKQQGLI